MTFDRINEFCARARKRANKKGCTGCSRVAQLGIKTERSLTRMARSGCAIEEIKDAIREHGWYCKKCIRKFQGTSATTTTLRDQFPPGPSGDRVFNRHRYEVGKNSTPGYILSWDEEKGDYSMVLDEEYVKRARGLV